MEPEDRTYNLDHIKIEQVLQNLMANALRFSRPESTVQIRAAECPEGLVFSVCDAGQGLTSEQTKHVFEKFARFSPTAQEGSGLGLAIAKSLVQLHGGRIWVESEVGKGARFTFTIAPQPDPAARSPTPRRKR